MNIIIMAFTVSKLTVLKVVVLPTKMSKGFEPLVPLGKYPTHNYFCFSKKQL